MPLFKVRAKGYSSTALNIASNNIRKIESVLFGFNTRAGKGYDIAHLLVIVISVLTTMATSVASLNQVFRWHFSIIEWILTILFTGDYCLRLYSVRKRMKYATSFLVLSHFEWVACFNSHSEMMHCS